MRVHRVTTQLKRLQANVTKAAGKDPVMLMHQLEESHAKARQMELANEGLKRKLLLERVKGGGGAGAKAKRGSLHNVRSRVVLSRPRQGAEAEASCDRASGGRVEGGSGRDRGDGQPGPRAARRAAGSPILGASFVHSAAASGRKVEAAAGAAGRKRPAA